jgi:hypothetical protein
MLVLTYSPSTWEAEAEGSGLGYVARLCLKIKKGPVLLLISIIPATQDMETIKLMV